MIKGTNDELARIIGTHRCPEHPDLELTVAQHIREGLVIRCGAGHYPEEVKRLPTRTEEYKRGELEAVDKSFNLLPRADLETGEVLSPSQIQALIAYAHKYGLDAYRGHVVLMHGQPYVGLDGYLYRAFHQGLSHSLIGRPLTPEEMASLGYDVGDLGWKSTITILATGAVFEGLGFVRKSELTERSKKHPERLRYPVVADKPANMVVKRADWQALRRAFPIGEEDENGHTD